MAKETATATRTDRAEKFVFAQVKGFNQAGELEAVASTGAIDRQSEIIEPEAWRGSLETYRANPVILATHLHRLTTGDSPVIGSAAAIDLTRDGLVFRLKFASTDLGRQYEALYRERHMRAFSVGFMPAKGEWREFQRTGKAAARIWVHTEVELLEISAVPVPANPEALARMRELQAKAAAPIDTAGVADATAALVIASLTKTIDERIDAHLQKHLETLADLIVDQVDEIKALLPDDVGAGSETAPGALKPDLAAAAGKSGADTTSAAARQLAASLKDK